MGLYVDVTTRHPWAQRYRQAALAANTAAVAAPERYATKQKENRYAKQADGIPIVVAVLGTWGRMGDGLQDILDLLSRRAAHARADNGLHATCRRRRWVEEIAIAQQRCLHRQLATALQPDSKGTVQLNPTAVPTST